jgi:cytochrome c5
MSGEEIAAVADFILGLFGDSAPTSDTGSEADAPGAHLYASLCAACHGAVGEGGSGGAIVGEDIDAEEIRELLREGDDGMPAYPDLTDDEVEALVEHTLLLAEGAIEPAELPGGEDQDEPDEDRDSENQGVSMFLGDEDDSGGRSPFVVFSMLTVLIAIVGTVGVMWLRSAKALAE